MLDYQARLRKDIARWLDRGLIDSRIAEALLRDSAGQPKEGTSFGSVLAVMASILIGAALLVFIAANWEGIPRVTRVLALFALIASSYVGGAWLKLRDHPAFGEGLYLVGAAAFGGSIALLGQMYHMAGDELQAILTWCLGTLVAAIGLRSTVLTNAAVVIAAIWFVMREMDFNAATPHAHGFLLVGAAIWAASYWTGSRAARHLLVLCLILYAFMIGIDGLVMEVGLLLAAISALVFAAAYLRPVLVERLTRLGGPYPAHPLIGFLVGMAMIQVEIVDQFGAMLLATLVAFAGIVAALVLRGRESRLMRWIAYAAFTVEVCFAYVVTVGTMMDTAGLFLFSGVAFGIAAFLIIRIEKRLSPPSPAVQGGTA